MLFWQCPSVCPSALISSGLVRSILLHLLMDIYSFWHSCSPWPFQLCSDKSKVKVKVKLQGQMLKFLQKGLSAWDFFSAKYLVSSLYFEPHMSFDINISALLTPPTGFFFFFFKYLSC